MEKGKKRWLDKRNKRDRPKRTAETKEEKQEKLMIRPSFHHDAGAIIITKYPLSSLNVHNEFLMAAGPDYG